MNPGDIRGVCHFTQWNAYTRQLIWPSLVRKWLVIKFGSAPNLYLKQCLFIVNTTFNKYWIQIQQSPYTITNSNMSSAEWWQFCLRLDNSNCIAFWINCCVWRVHVTNENFCRFPEATDKEIECMIEALHMANIWCQRTTHANAFWISISMSGICLKASLYCWSLGLALYIPLMFVMMTAWQGSTSNITGPLCMDSSRHTGISRLKDH